MARRNGCGWRAPTDVVRLPNPFVMKHWLTGAVWFAFVAIAALYFFGLAASFAIPFGPPISFASVARQVSVSDFVRPDAVLPFHCVVFAASVAMLFIHSTSQSRRVRIVLPLVCLFAPLFWTNGGIKGIAQWLLAMPLAPFFTFTALAGLQDGEFYAEGFLVFTAIGWWMILWCFLLSLELRSSRRDPR